MWAALVGVVLLLGGGLARGEDAALERRMEAVDQRAGQISDLVGSFEQRKFTALMKKPLVSMGTVRVKGSRMRWDTQHPEPSVMVVQENDIRLYYPKQKVLEVYGVDQKLASLAASPLPRLEVLKRYFSFHPASAKALWEQADESKHLAVEMIPTDPALKEHLERVRVLLEAQSGLIVRAETTDADGDRTLLVFSNVRTNTGLTDRDLELEVPANVNIIRPLDGLSGAGKRAKGQ